MSSFGLEVLAVAEVHSDIEKCLRGSPKLEYEGKSVGYRGCQAAAEDLDEAVGNAKRSDVVETEDAKLNEEIIVCGSSDHDCCIGGLTRQAEVVIALERVVSTEAAVPNFQYVIEAELFCD
jgi:hypothetical protein